MSEQVQNSEDWGPIQPEVWNAALSLQGSHLCKDCDCDGRSSGDVAWPSGGSPLYRQGQDGGTKLMRLLQDFHIVDRQLLL
ncbi:hypothetical protein NPIL_396581 [Nephila pilipes]|uniref:Uncharacterized protein n=1 Tax=Nephila pilipes TaxID=299642 RepID=A0A8X6TAE5_NEPPI|nr:hypothetical protein NPIL_396581 [Nephila pilipes]